MTSRRQFLQTSAAISALAVHGLVPRNAEAVRAARRAGLVPHRAIYDDRYAECREFAATAAAFGAPARSLEHGDVTQLYDELDVAWRTAPASVAGTTQFGPMFVLERLAAERRMRLVLRVEHRPNGDGTLRHVMAAAPSAADLAARLFAAGLEWPVVMAALVCQGGHAAAPLSARTLQSRAAPPELPPGNASAESFIHYYTPQRVQQGYGPAVEGHLYSWLVAPV